MGMTADEQRLVEEFRRDVVEPSMEKLIILDFWAEWCGPCKQLTPLLEKVAATYADRGVHLVKVNVDENKFIASQFQVRSIPTVYAMFQGKPVADLTPARTEAQLTQTLDALLQQLPVTPGAWTGGAPPPPDFGPMIDQAEMMLEAGDAASAHDLFANVLLNEPDNAQATGGLARALVVLDRNDEARAMLDALGDAPLAVDPAIVRARSALAIAADRRDPSELAALRAAVDAAPDDLGARFALANALVAAGDHDGGADALLAIIAADREWEDGKARARLLQLFDLIGLEDPWVAATRRRLSAVLFG